jgi:outer membrane protein, heavy metal efflux system
MISFVLKPLLAKVQGGSNSRRVLVRAGLQWILAAALLAVSAPVAADGPDRAERSESMDGASFPSLAEVVAFAKERAPTVVTARMDVGVANASYAGARLAPVDNPYLEVFLDRGGGTVTRDVAVQANLWLPIEMAGQQGRRIAEVDALVEWQKTRMESVQFNASGEAVRAYGDVLVAAERTRTLADIVQVASAEAKFYAERLTAGDATLHDERLARVELGRTTILLEESRADLVRSKMRLSRVVGRNVDEPGPAMVVAAPAPVEMTETGAARTAAQSVHVRASEREADYFARSAERSAVEAHVPVNVIVSAGRGDLGETRVGAGLAWTFPVLRKNQGEQARARAERARALTEADVMRRLLGQALQALHAERIEVRRALKTLETVTEPAARDSVEAAVVLKSAGKVDSLRVLTARRDLAMVRLRRLELLARDWAIVGDIVALTGKLP